MDFHWIKPMRKPPRVDGMSASARRVLEALRNRFQEGFGGVFHQHRSASGQSAAGMTSSRHCHQRELFPSSATPFPNIDDSLGVNTSIQHTNAPSDDNDVPLSFGRDYPADDVECHWRSEIHENPGPQQSPLWSSSVFRYGPCNAEPDMLRLANETSLQRLDMEKPLSPISLYANASPISLCGDRMVASQFECSFSDDSPSNNFDGGRGRHEEAAADECGCRSIVDERNEALSQEVFQASTDFDSHVNSSAPLKDDDLSCSLLLFRNNSSFQSEEWSTGFDERNNSAELNVEQDFVQFNENKTFHKMSDKTILVSLPSSTVSDNSPPNVGKCFVNYTTFNEARSLTNSPPMNVSCEDLFDTSCEEAIISLIHDSGPKTTGCSEPVEGDGDSNQERQTKRKYLGNAFKRAFTSAVPSTSSVEIVADNLTIETNQSKLIELQNPLECRLPGIFTTCVRQNNSVQSDNLITNCSRDETQRATQNTHLIASAKESKTPEKINFRRLDEDKPETTMLSVRHTLQPMNVTSRTKYVNESTSYTQKKKKNRFIVPFKDNKIIHKDVERHSHHSKSAVRQLSQKDAQELMAKVHEAAPIELALTILFQEGFTQLNKPKHPQACNPTAILLRITWESDSEIVSVSWTSSWSSRLLKSLLLTEHRNICFGAQEMCQLLIDKFNFSANEVSFRLLLLDPLVGCWLLNPDQPPETFDDATVALKMEQTLPSVMVRSEHQLLERLSKSAECLYRLLTANGLWKLFLHLEMRITPILACMELCGINVNIQKLQEMSQQLERQMSTLQQEAHSSAGKVFQLTSPQQLSTILYDELHLDVKSNIKVKGTTRRQQKSTSESTIVQFKDIHPLPGIIIEFRKLHKLKTTYIDSVLGQATGSTISATWHQTSVATGRIVSSDPNLQAIPKQPMEIRNPQGPLNQSVSLRSAYTARSGHSFVAADFQHIELRVFAHLSKDAALIQALHQPHDIFLVLAKRWLECNSMHEVGNEDRDKTKRIVYALMYGAGPSKLMEFLHVDYLQASKILKSFTDTFPSMREFTRRTSDICRDQGYLATESGRRRWFPNIRNVNLHLRQQAERQAVNFLIQGTAADICKCAMVQAQRRLAMNSTEARLLLQIHDELVWEVQDSDVQQVAELVQSAMEEATAILPTLQSFSVPLPVIVKQGKSWADMTIIKETAFGPSQRE